jgi:putative ABC transport system ATP-binding protein
MKRILNWLRGGSQTPGTSAQANVRIPPRPDWLPGLPAPAVHPSAPKLTLRARGLAHGFGSGEGRTEVLRHIDLDLHRGQLILLMGPSGSGKSTLLASLSGLLRPEAGSVHVLGQDLWGLPVKEQEHFRLEHFGFVFQGYNLFPALTARQQLEIVLRWGQGLGGREARYKVDEMLDRLGLGGKGHLRPAQLSGGEKQRVAIGRAMVKQPGFCFADEPTSALDWTHGEQVVLMLREIARERGATVLVVGHDPRLVPHADRVFHLDAGHLSEGHTDARPRPVFHAPHLLPVLV